MIAGFLGGMIAGFLGGITAGFLGGITTGFPTKFSIFIYFFLE